jgi:hypothetical protein
MRQMEIRLAGERPLATTYSESDKPYPTKKKRAGVPGLRYLAHVDAKTAVPCMQSVSITWLYGPGDEEIARTTETPSSATKVARTPPNAIVSLLLSD